MEPVLDQIDNMADTQLTKMRWALGLNGLLSIAIGVVILLWPGVSLCALTILVGAYALARLEAEASHADRISGGRDDPGPCDRRLCFRDTARAAE